MTAGAFRLFAVAIVWLVAAGALADASLVTVTGNVEIGSGTPVAWRAAQAGDRVAPGDSIRTGAGARAELRLGDQRVARLYERSLLRVGLESTAQGSVRSVDLDEGASLFDLLRKAVVDEFDVRTPEIIVSVKGTRFLVEASAAADTTSVFRGEVSLSGSEFDPVAVRPGFTGRLGEIEPTPFADPWDAWAAGEPAPTHALKRLSDEAELRAALKEVRDATQPPAKLLDVEVNGLLDGAGGSPDRVRDAGTGELLDGIGDIATEAAQAVPQATDLLGAVLGGATEVFPFDFDVSIAGAPNVTVSLGGQAVTLDQGMIDTILAGDTTPLGTLNGPIATLGVDPVGLAGFLDSLF